MFYFDAIGIKTQRSVDIVTGTDNQNDIAKSTTKGMGMGGMGGITSKKKSTKQNAKK
jgi:hypothetical protein